jgi:uncharacterized protein involved in exopolysaccharide biosynthesis
MQDTSLLRDVVYVIFKRKAVLITLAVVGVAIMIYGLKTGVASYEASARVLIKRQHQGYVMPSETRGVLKRAEVVNSEISIITSTAVAEAVVDRLELATGDERPLAIYRMSKKLKAQEQPESDIIDISYRHTDAQMAADVVNAALDAYLEIRKAVALNYDAVVYLDSQADRVRAERDSTAMALALFGGERGELVRGRLAEQQMGLQNRFENELATLNSHIQSFEEKLAMVDEWLASGADPSHIPSGEIYATTSVQQAKNRLVELELTMAGVSAKYTADHPALLKLEREVAATQVVLQKEVRQALARQRMRIDEWKAERRAVLSMLDDLHSTDVDLAKNLLTIRLLEDDLRIHVDMYGIIMDRREQFRITAATDPNLLNIGIVARASIPARPTPQPVNMRVVVGLFTIIFGVLLVFTMERADNSLERREDIQRVLGLKVLATIPERK